MADRIKEFFEKEIGRDWIFKEVVSLFDKAPLKIGEIGCARSPAGRAGDGWSTFFWANYIEKFGGELHTCDIDEKAIEFTKNSIPENYNVTYYCMGGEEFIKENGPFDFVYLDGSNDPKEAQAQFNLLKNKTDVILVDDWWIKGFDLIGEYERILYQEGEGRRERKRKGDEQLGWPALGLIATPEKMNKLYNLLGE